MKEDNIPGYPNFYVSKRGRVWKRIRDGTWKELRYIKNPTRGYLYVRLNGKSFRLNRLVALVHIPNQDNLPIVMHLDNNIYNNIYNNHYKNLQWGTYKMNTQQMMRDGRNRGQFKSTLTKQQINLILEKYTTGKYSQIQLAKLVGLKSQGRISRIINKYQRVRMEP